MKISRDEIINGGMTKEPMPNIVFASIVDTFKDEGFANFLKHIDWDNKEEIEVKLIVEGVELDMRKVCERWDKDIDRQIKEKALELMAEQFQPVSIFINNIERIVKRKAREQLGLEPDEYDW